jgi:hypothetical protein
MIELASAPPYFILLTKQIPKQPPIRFPENGFLAAQQPPILESYFHH